MAGLGRRTVTLGVRVCDGVAVLSGRAGIRIGGRNALISDGIPQWAVHNDGAATGSSTCCLRNSAKPHMLNAAAAIRLRMSWRSSTETRAQWLPQLAVAHRLRVRLPQEVSRP